MLTLIATDTRSMSALFAVSGGSDDGGLLLLDLGDEAAQVYSDPLAGGRRGASHGPGPFLAAARCGDRCLQPVQFRDGSWAPLGGAARQDDDATLHFTYEAAGAPWMLLQRLTGEAGVSQVDAFRWDGRDWRGRGGLRVRGVGSPAAVPDPRRPDAVLIGTGRFAAAADPSYWLPALPAAEGASGGQVVALGGSAVYLTFDSRLYFSSDGGVTWFAERWTPWSPRAALHPLWTPGIDFWFDLPVAPRDGNLPVLWYDERRGEAPSVYLARWRERTGWDPPQEISLTGDGALSIDQALATDSGKWLLLGPCRGAALDALVVQPGSRELRRTAIALHSDRADD